MSEIRNKTIKGLKTGDEFTVARTFSEEDMTAFARVTRDYNPVHFDDRFASEKKFKGRICHGLLTAGMVTEIGGQIGWLATQMNFEFKKPVYFDDTITCTMTITKIDDSGRAEAEASLANEKGELVCYARLTGLLPRTHERKILNSMVEEGDPTNKLS